MRRLPGKINRTHGSLTQVAAVPKLLGLAAKSAGALVAPARWMDRRPDVARRLPVRPTMRRR